nr:hypothetical protein [Eisenbergiella tayi]
MVEKVFVPFLPDVRIYGISNTAIEFTMEKVAIRPIIIFILGKVIAVN